MKNVRSVGSLWCGDVCGEAKQQSKKKRTGDSGTQELQKAMTVEWKNGNQEDKVKKIKRQKRLYVCAVVSGRSIKDTDSSSPCTN